MGELMKDRLARTLEMMDSSREAEVMDEICQRVSEGEGLPVICRSKDVLYGKLMMWLMSSEGRWGLYRKALEIGAHAMGSEVLEIADDEVPTVPGGGYDSAAVSDKKVRIDARLKLMKAHAREMYGDVRKVEHSLGGDFGERLRRARERVVEGSVGGLIEDARVVSEGGKAGESVAVVAAREQEWL